MDADAERPMTIETRTPSESTHCRTGAVEAKPECRIGHESTKDTKGEEITAKDAKVAATDGHRWTRRAQARVRIDQNAEIRNQRSELATKARAGGQGAGRPGREAGSQLLDVGCKK